MFWEGWASNDPEPGELPVYQSPFSPTRDGEGVYRKYKSRRALCRDFILTFVNSGPLLVDRGRPIDFVKHTPCLGRDLLMTVPILIPSLRLDTAAIVPSSGDLLFYILFLFEYR